MSAIRAPARRQAFSNTFVLARLIGTRGEKGCVKALEELGPIFVKFGQVLSTRRDLMPPDIADELALLQDRVPSFDPDLAVAQIPGP